MTTFSTIIPCFNRQSLIAATIDSVLAQAEQTEIIVVDDGSTDGSTKILEGYGDRVTILRQQNRGPGAARNLGAGVATGDYLCFLDSDDLWFPWTLKTYRQVIERYNRPSFLLATAIPFSDETALPTSATTAKPTVEAFPDFYAAAPLDMWHGCSVAVVRSDKFRAAGGFCPRNINAEDTDLWLKLGISPGFTLLRSPPTAGYREHSASAVADMTKTRDGMLHLIQQERAGNYPGGAARRAQRLMMLTRHLRAASMHCLKTGQTQDAWRLYRASFAWNFRQRRIRYLLGFPVKTVVF